MSTRLSGGGARHHRVDMTPKLMINNVSADNPNSIPTSKSYTCEPTTGRIVNSANRPQQFNNDITVTKTYPIYVVM